MYTSLLILSSTSAINFNNINFREEIPNLKVYWIFTGFDSILADMAKQYTVLAAGVVCVSFAALFIRVADAPPLVIATYRLCLAALLLLPLSWKHARQELSRFSKRDLLMILLAGVFLAVHFGLWITSLSYTSVATSVVLVTVSPIFLALASRFLFNQKLHRQAIFGIIISLGGAVLISYGNWQLGERPFEGAMLALGGAITISGYLLVGQRLRSRIGTLTYTTTVFGTAAILLLVVTLASGYALTGYSGQTYTMMALLALVPQLIGHTSLNWSLRFVPATLVAVAVLGEPVGATIWAFVFLGEKPAAMEIIGSILILFGIFVAMRNRVTIRLHIPGT
jgi:drug/metabolite transporter (DMT)-like permease